MIGTGRTISTALLLLTLSSCGGPVGGGSTSTSFGDAAYGVDADGISYVILTNADTVATTSGGSGGIGSSVSHGAFQLVDSTIEFRSDGETLSLLGEALPLDRGRVFALVSEDSKLRVLQLDLPIERAAEGEAEIRRLAADAHVLAHFGGQ